jgi:quinol monooxygenase YgiN
MDNLEVYLVIELAINLGRFEDLKTLMADMVEATQKNEVGTLNYEWTISDDHQVCHAYERYRDSAAFMTHLESFGANFAVRLMEAVTPARLVVYGTPSPQVKDALAGLSPVYMAPLGGFRR